MKVPFKVGYDNYLTPEERNGELAFNVQPLMGSDRVIEKSQIVIRAPSEIEIKSLALQLWDSNEQSSSIRLGLQDEIQLVRMGAAGTSYLQNESEKTLECSKSDIVVRGTLLLRNLKINAAGGCRLYVSGTVFIEGAITYIGGGDLQNLQITSSSAIIMGLNSNTVSNRLVGERRGLQLVARDYGLLAEQIVREANNIGNLKDATDSTPRASIDFSGLLLNAPIVHSRYLGTVKGTIIAEAVLFALGKFEFAFDPVFTKVNVLPLLKKPVLSVN